MIIFERATRFLNESFSKCGIMRAILITISLAICLTVPGLAAPNAQTQDSARKVVVEDIPSLADIKRVSANKTHSGYPVPRYVSLKFDRVNGRKGPSTKHPKAWEYHRKGLPLVVVAEMDIWRKVRDMHGDESWVRTYALSGNRYVMTLETLPLRAKAKGESRVIATAPKDTVLHLMTCVDTGWCRVKSDTGYKGWARQKLLWGTEPL